jgi:purine-binding chemotaxis protein CheW
MGAAPVSQYLSFFIAGEEFAVPILRVREILQCDTFTRVPSAPPFIRGVINLRGSVLPVVDLALKVGLPGGPLTRFSCIVVLEVALEGEPLLVGGLVDQVSQVLDFGPEDLEPKPSFGPRIRLDYLAGMGKQDKRFVLLLDIDRVLSAGELQLAESVSESATQTAETAPAAGEQ